MDPQTVEDEKLLTAHYGSNTIAEELRGLFLAEIKGGDEGVRRYIREQFPKNHPPAG